jgi:hypothetical protein
VKAEEYWKGGRGFLEPNFNLNNLRFFSSFHDSSNNGERILMVLIRRQPQSISLGIHGKATFETRANLTNQAKLITRDTRFLFTRASFKSQHPYLILPRRCRSPSQPRHALELSVVSLDGSKPSLRQVYLCKLQVGASWARILLILP